MAEDVRRMVGARLRQARLSAKLTQEDVASECQRSRQAVSSWERGETLPTLQEFRGLLILYSVSSDRILFDGEDFEGEAGRVLSQAARPGTLSLSGCGGG